MFEQIRPYLDNGVSFANAVKQVTGKKSFPIHNGFFRELIEYGRTLGYDYNDLKYGHLKKPSRKYCKKILHEDNVEVPVLKFDNQEWSF